MKSESVPFTNNTVPQKLAYAGHVLRVFSGSDAFLLLERKFKGKEAREIPERTCLE